MTKGERDRATEAAKALGLDCWDGAGHPPVRQLRHKGGRPSGARPADLVLAKTDGGPGIARALLEEADGFFGCFVRLEVTRVVRGRIDTLELDVGFFIEVEQAVEAAAQALAAEDARHRLAGDL
jgi:hypothetical protein